MSRDTPLSDQLAHAGDYTLVIVTTEWGQTPLTFADRITRDEVARNVAKSPQVQGLILATRRHTGGAEVTTWGATRAPDDTLTFPSYRELTDQLDQHRRVRS